MRQLRLTKTGLGKLKSHLKELKSTDFEDSIRSVPPGEWCELNSSNLSESWVAFINPLVDERYTCAHVVDRLRPGEVAGFEPESFIRSKLKQAYSRRERFLGYENGQRLFYGSSDGLPGLIVDQYVNASIIQINTSGIDRYRDLISDTIEDISGKKAYFLDNHKYREKESLPKFETESIPDLHIVENDIRYNVRAEVLQKVGFYYDHRENRHQLIQTIARLKPVPQKGLDLFCYVGAWGLNALKAGLKHCDFVDQGDFFTELNDALTMNGLAGQGQFHRQDVFKFLDAAIQAERKYDLILSDPPAFAKSPNQKGQALEGYSKLHRKVFKLAATKSLCVFSSCTHYISHEEFQKNVLDAAHKEGKQVQLLYSGIQGWDHPISSLEDRANYIKSYFYILE